MAKITIFRDGEYLEVDEATHAPAIEPVLPLQVTRAQAKLALHRAGLLPQVKAAVNQSGEEIKIWFDEALYWDEDDPNVQSFAQGMGLTQEQLHGLFVAAKEIGHGPEDTPSSPEGPETPQGKTRRGPRAGHGAGSKRPPKKGKGAGVRKVAPVKKRPRR
jgi:hypothetical protein